jgi:hypothetical protein
MRLRLLVFPFQNDTWSIPRAMHWVLTNHTQCKRTLYLDSDLYVHPRWNPRTDARFDPNASFQAVRFVHRPPSTKSTINTGAFLFKSDEHARALADWWQSAASGSCPLNVPTPEQNCFQRAPHLAHLLAHPRALRLDVSNASAGVQSWHIDIDIFGDATNLSAIQTRMTACRASLVPVCHAPGIRFLCKRLPNRLGSQLKNCGDVVRSVLFCTQPSVPRTDGSRLVFGGEN